MGYPRIPGLYDAAQADAWKATTTAVHAQGGKIFVQFMHCGRVVHVANLPVGAEVLGPGTAVCPGEMYTDTLGMQPHSPPRAMTGDDAGSRRHPNLALSATIRSELLQISPPPVPTKSDIQTPPQNRKRR